MRSASLPHLFIVLLNVVCSKNIGLRNKHVITLTLRSTHCSCRRFGLSPFWFVAVLPVAVLVCRRFGHGNLSPFWRVAVLVCRRFDHTPLAIPLLSE